MKLKHWGIVVVIGFGEAVLSSVLLRLGAPRLLGQVLVVGGVAVFFGGLIGIIVYDGRHPAQRCPQCGKGVDIRHVKRPGGGTRLTGREPICCPYCGAMFQPWNL